MQEKDKEWWSPQELVLVGIEPPSGWKGKAEGAVTGIYRQRWLWAGDSLWPLMEEPSQLAVIPKGGLWGNKYPVLPFPLLQFPVGPFHWPNTTRGRKPGEPVDLATEFSCLGSREGMERVDGGIWKGEPKLIGHASALGSAIPLWGTYPRQVHTLVHKEVYAKLSMTAWLRIEKKWKQPYCSLLSCYIAVLNKLWVICRMKWHIDIKVDELEISVL